MVLPKFSNSFIQCVRSESQRFQVFDPRTNKALIWTTDDTAISMYVVSPSDECFIKEHFTDLNSPDNKIGHMPPYQKEVHGMSSA